MLGRVNWVARVAGFCWIGVVAFAIFPPSGGGRAAVLVVGYALLGLGLAAWALVASRPALARHRARALPACYGAMAVGAGLGSTPGSGGTLLIVYAFIAAMMAGGDLDLPAALGVAAAGILAVEVGGLLTGGGYPTFLGLPVCVLAGVVVGRNRGVYRVRAEQTAALLAQREVLADQQRRADLLDERARIAREIHDVLAHSLGALGIQIQAARAVLEDSADIPKATELLANAQQLAGEGLEETRRAVMALRTDAAPLADDLAGLCEAHTQRYRVSVDLAVSGEADGEPAPLRPDASLALLRIAQEALVNAAKHAPGRDVAVRLDHAGGRVRLTVRNPLPDGAATRRHPAPETVGGGYGLPGMRERVRLLDGTLRAEGRAGAWTVTAELPVPQARRLAP